jgi:hypothetical protein
MQELIEILKQIPCLPFCCQCKRGINLNGQWVYLSAEEGQEVNDMPNVSHGYCPLCYNEVMKEIKLLKSQKV